MDIFQIIQESDVEQSKAFKFKGIAMIKDSTSGNGRHYSSGLVDRTVQSVKNIIESTGSYPLTVMADHPGIVSNKTLSTVGKITDMYLEGNNAVIEAEIANTTVGKDVQELIRGKFIEGLSIRASKAKFEKKYIGDKLVNNVLEMELNGVDLVTNPGVKGARVLDILESDENSGIYISIEEDEIVGSKEPIKEDIMDYSKITLEELKKERKDLVENLKGEFKPLFESEFKVNELQESVDNLTEGKKELDTKLEESEKKTAELEETLKDTSTKLEETEKQLAEIKEAEEKAIAEAEKAKRETHISESISKLKFADSIKEKIKEKVSVLESIEEIDTKIAEEVSYLELAIKESTGVDLSSKGKTKEEDELSEDEAFHKMVMES